MILPNHPYLQRAVVALASAALVASGLAGCATPHDGGAAWIDGIVVDTQRLARPGETGLVRVIRDGATIEGRAGMALRAGDRIATGGNAEAVIRYASGTQLFLRPASGGRIGSFSAMVGEVFAKIRGLFEVETTFVRAGAQGTAFLVRTDAGGATVVIVFDGRVRVDSTRGAWAPVTMTAGQMAVGHPRAPQPMPAGAAELQATRDWVERLERMVPPPSGASGAATAAVVAGVAVLVAAILAGRSDRRDGAPDADGGRGAPQDAPRPLAAPTGLAPGQPQSPGPRVDCRRSATLAWNAVAGAREYRVRLEALDASRVWRAVALAPAAATRIEVPAAQLGTSNRWSVQARDGDRAGPASPTLYFGCDFVYLR